MEMHAEFVYLALAVITSVFCFRANTQDSFLCLLIIWFLFIAAQVPEWWNYPGEMLFIHAGVFFITLGGLHNGVSVRMQVLTTCMAVIDGLWVIFSYIDFPANSLDFPFHLFWWQSVINLLFVAMCLTIIVGCINTIKIAKHKGKVTRFGFMARSTQKIAGGV
jgi:hypothetical protein